jgi:hypothetical protein
MASIGLGRWRAPRGRACPSSRTSPPSSSGATLLLPLADPNPPTPSYP